LLGSGELLSRVSCVSNPSHNGRGSFVTYYELDGRNKTRRNQNASPGIDLL
jgi:hypothetical protein